MTDKNFEQALKAAGKTVESWPAWKQNSLLVTTMATSPTPRQPIDPPEAFNQRNDGQSQRTK